MLVYVGPNQIVPLSGALGAMGGLAIAFWGKILHAFRKIAQAFSPKVAEEGDDEQS